MLMQRQMRMRFLRSKQALETAEWAILGAAIIVIVYGAYQMLGAQIVRVVQQIAAGL